MVVDNISVALQTALEVMRKRQLMSCRW